MSVSRTFVAGSWEMNQHEIYGAVFEVVRLAGRWNGWAVPVVTRYMLESMVARQAWLNTLDTRFLGVDDRWVLREDGVLEIHVPEQDFVQYVEPNEEGHYVLDIGYTFEVIAWEDLIDEDEPVRAHTIVTDGSL